MKFTRMPENTFKQLQLNAGIITTDFDIETGEVQEADLLGATTGGVSFTATPEYSDFGEDIDNCPVNVYQLKQLDSWTITMSGTFVTIDAKAAARLIGAGDVDKENTMKIKPRNDVLDTDFKDLWWIGDYSDVNLDNEEKGGNAGFVAVHMMNALSTGGFQIQSGNREKGQFAFEFTGHYSIDAQDTVPFEVYIMSGADESGDRKMTIPDNSGNLDGFLPSGGDGVNISDIMENDVKVNWNGTNGNVIGTFPYKSEFESFSTKPEEKSGHYFALELGDEYEGKPITVKGMQEKTAVDRKWVLRIDGVVEAGKKFTFSTDGKQIATLDFANATLKPNVE